MKKQYENPIIEIIEFEQEDILTASFGGSMPGDNDINDNSFWD